MRSLDGGLRVAMVSEHASPLAALGGVDAGGQNVHVAELAMAMARRGARVTVHTRRDGRCALAPTRAGSPSCRAADGSVRRLKGPGRPLVGEVDRAAILDAFDCVDAVVLFDEPTPAAVLDALRPDVFAKGGDDTALSDLPEAVQFASWGHERAAGGRSLGVVVVTGGASGPGAAVPVLSRQISRGRGIRGAPRTAPPDDSRDRSAVMG